ncbi:MAG: twin-arginine translocase subunit TatC [Flavobacteriaceae bacterium]|nr:twin-arginine translocase subunit TatC [Flavobacteriaceae bacterium]
MEKNNKEMSFLGHLDELRKRLFKIAVAVFAVAIVAFFFKDFIFDVIIFGPKDPNFITYRTFCQISRYFGTEGLCIDEIPFVIQSRTMSGQFNAHMWTSIIAGVIIAFPYILYQLWLFISPALYENEKKYAATFVIISSFLFFVGVLFGYYIITPLSINFLGAYRVSEQVLSNIDIDSYMSLLRTSVLVSGIIFELPIIIYFLTKLGVVTPTFLRTYRKHALVGVLIISAVITPPDVVSQIIVSIPILLLYEISILISVIVYKKKLKKELTNE